MTGKRPGLFQRPQNPCLELGVTYSIMIQTFCPHFGNGIADLVPGSEVGENPVEYGPYLDLSARLTNVGVIPVKRWVWMVAWYSGLYVIMGFVLIMFSPILKREIYR